MISVPKKGIWRCVIIGEESVCWTLLVSCLIELFRKDYSLYFADSVLSDSQCGFRQEHSYVDMIFVVRQLVEKAREYCLFYTLNQSQEGSIWLGSKCGRYLRSAESLLSVIHSFHAGMSTSREQVWQLLGFTAVYDRYVKLFLCFYTCISVLLLRIGINSVLRLVCLFIILMDRKLVGDLATKSHLSV